jgi:hypothetical protein
MLDDMAWRNDRHRDEGRPTLMDVDWIRQDLGVAAAAP